MENLQALEAKTGKPSQRLASRPKLRGDVQGIWNAYQDLADTRQYNSAGIQPFTLSEIRLHADMCGIRGREPALLFCRYIRAMDTEHRKWWADKRAKEAPKGKTPTPRRPRK